MSLPTWLRGTVGEKLTGLVGPQSVTDPERSLTEKMALAVLTVTIVLGITLPVFSTVRASFENMEAEATLHSALLDVQAVYRMSHSYAPPRHTAQLLWPYLQERYPTLHWGKYSDTPSEVAVARSARGRRQSIELNVFSSAGLCWAVLVVMSSQSTVLTSGIGIRRPGVYYGATPATSCGPTYITPPASGWHRSPPGIALSGY